MFMLIKGHLLFRGRGGFDRDSDRDRDRGYGGFRDRGKK